MNFGGVYALVPMPACLGAGKKLLDLIWVDTDKSVDPAHKELPMNFVPGNTKRRIKAGFKEHDQLLCCSLQCHLLKQ